MVEVRRKKRGILLSFPIFEPNQPSAFYHGSRFHFLQPLKQNKISQLSRTDHPAVIQVHPSGRGIGSAVDGLLHRYPRVNGGADNVV